jgi:glycosyltransferase involved in cell wall biosynthesis
MSGGVEQVVAGLASGLSSLESNDEEYVFLCLSDEDAWLRPNIGGSCRIQHAASRQTGAAGDGAMKQTLNRLPGVDRVKKRLPAFLFPAARPARSDGTVESIQADIVHFTSQGAFLTDIPSIYHPHDLQHLHLPQFFSPRQRRDRERLYRAFCGQATMVATSSEWTRRDVIDQYGLPDEKVRVVPLAPPLAAYPSPTEGDLFDVQARFGLPQEFLLYPAQTWEHKNHLGLLEALALLRDEHGLKLSLVCSGRQNAFFPKIERALRRLRLEDQVRFVGFVSPVELQALYRLSRGVVIPTRFESGSFPLWEAFFAGVPAACSKVTSLPEQAGDAALLFDPAQPAEIAVAIQRLWTDEGLRADLVERGHGRVAELSWENTARIFRAHYRRIAGRELSAEDRELLQSQAADCD